jgi:ABC-type anion transport system duplicated permease subunit
MESISITSFFVIVSVLLTAFAFFVTIKEGVQTWLKYPRKMHHVRYGRLFGICLLISVVAIELFIHTGNHPRHEKDLLFRVHLYALVPLFLLTYVVLLTKRITPKKDGVWHYLMGIFCTLLFIGVAITGTLLFLRL